VVYPIAAADMQSTIPRFSLAIAGKKVVDERDLVARGDVRAPMPDAIALSDVLFEEHAEGRFAAIRIRPDWEAVPTPKHSPSSRRYVIVVDTSRSSLESCGLAKQAVERLVKSLGPGDEFVVLASDLTTRSHAEAPVSKSEAKLSAALAFLDGIEPDGASDLGAAFDAIAPFVSPRDSGQRVDVIYVGDGTATWGEIEGPALVAKAREILGSTALHALALGKGSDVDALRELTGATGGRTMQPHSPAQIARFATFLHHAPDIKSLRGVELDIEGVDPVRLEMPPAGTWFEGEEPIVYLQAGAGASMPAEATLSAHAGPEVVRQTIYLGKARRAPQVARLWAARRVTELQSQGEFKDEVIELSEVFGVLSRHTALLVLESEEAYKRAQIERRRAAEQAARNGDPAVSGADLESLGQDRARLSPGDIQPGDPEIHVPAPRNAQSVVVVFPFGETKLARWEDALGKWTVRFLVDAATAPGKYEVQIRITHADGSVETRTAHYTVDVTAADVRIGLEPVAGKPDTFEVVAKQALTEDDRARTRRDGLAGTEAGTGVLDVKRVELVMPDGQTLTLKREAAGEFRRRWTPRSPVAWPAEVEVVTTDRALNVGRATLTLEAPAR
jgi:hypothetical protein